MYKKEHKNFQKGDFKDYILAGDIGGTNTSLGLFGLRKSKPTLLVSFRFKSQKLKGLHEAVNQSLYNILNDYKIKVTKGSFAVAGVIDPTRQSARITHVKWNVDVKSLKKATKLKRIFLLNDFEAIGHSINILDPHDYLAIRKTKKINFAPKVVIGAGTGLGKCTLLFDPRKKSYVPVQSEAGHAEFSAQTQEEFDLVTYLKKKNRVKSVVFEEVLSGYGIANIYSFLRHKKYFPPTKYTKKVDIAGNKQEIISSYRKIDATCRKTFEIFRNNYAKFARNTVLDSIALGGIYIAGGIAPKNKDIFDREFLRIFEDSTKMKAILKKTPVYLIENYDVGMIGAAFVGVKEIPN